MRKRGRFLRELWGKEADFEVEKEIAKRILRKWGDWENSEGKEISEVNNEISEGILIESRTFLRKSKRCLREFWGTGDLWVNFEGKNWFLMEKEMATHSSNSCLENPMDRATWWATVHRVAKLGTVEWLYFIDFWNKERHLWYSEGKNGNFWSKGDFWGNSLGKKGISEGILKKRRWVWGLLKGGWEGSERM